MQAQEKERRVKGNDYIWFRISFPVRCTVLGASRLPPRSPADSFVFARATMRLVNRGRTRVRQPAGKRVKSNAHLHTDMTCVHMYAQESGGLIAGEAGAERATAAYATIFLHERE